MGDNTITNIEYPDWLPREQTVNPHNRLPRAINTFYKLVDYELMLTEIAERKGKDLGEMYRDLVSRYTHHLKTPNPEWHTLPHSRQDTAMRYSFWRYRISPDPNIDHDKLWRTLMNDEDERAYRVEFGALERQIREAVRQRKEQLQTGYALTTKHKKVGHSLLSN